MKSILIPLRAGDDVETVLGNAAQVAKRFGAYMEGLVVEPLFNRIAVGEAMAALPAYDAQIREDWRKQAEVTHRHFEDAVAKLGVPIEGPDERREGPSAGWQILQGPESMAIGAYGRLFDLVVIERAEGDDQSIVTEACEAALFESGRPVLLTPRRPVGPLGETVVISWNGSTETARTLGLGARLIDGAKSVFVLTVEGATVPGPSGEQVVDHLKRRGIDAKAVAATPGDRSLGAAILEEASALGADLLVKGAYTHSRLRQFVFGGPTRHILSHADLPVLMAH